MKISGRRCLPIFLFICIIPLMASCTSKKMLEYYADENNYVQAVGVVHFINDVPENGSFILGFTDLEPQFSDTCFKLVGQNYEIAIENGINEKIQLGDTVYFSAAPRYFGDGYVMPIASITVDGEELLEFSVGYENIMVWLQNRQ